MRGCCHCILKCPFLLQIIPKCRETLSVACRRSKESKYTAVDDCFSFVLFNFHFEYTNPSFYGNMAGTGDNIRIWEYDNECVNIFILNLLNKLVAITENLVGHTHSLQVMGYIPLL